MLKNNFFIYYILIILFFILIFFNKNKSKVSTKSIAYSSICLSIAFVISLIPIFKMPQGGSVNFCSMIFLSLIGYWFGLKVGIISSISYGILNLLIFPHIYHPIQVILDYILGFGSLGVSGFFCNKKYGLYIGYILGMSLRLIFSIVSGAIFFNQFSNINSCWLYSISYNISYIIPETIITIIIIFLPPIKSTINKLNPSKDKKNRD